LIQNTKCFKLKCFTDNYGCLVPIETLDDIPFSIKRIYYIYKVENGARRGLHSHIDLKQVLICVHGAVTILVKTPYDEEKIILDDPTRALYIGPFIWREMYNFSNDAVLLVLASEHYNNDDYIREYEYYEKIARDYFENISGDE